MSEKEAGVWGITKNDRQTVHLFRENRRICPGKKRNQHGWLFVSRPAWDPDLPGTCEICKDLLRLEKIEEQAKETRKASV